MGETKLFSWIAGKLFGEIAEHLLETSIISVILKFTFGITLENAIVVALLVVVLSILKKIYYKEDLLLAFAVLLLFFESPILSWFLFCYISYFRGLSGLFLQKSRKSDRYSTLKSESLRTIGQYFAPIILIIIARKFRELRDNLLFLTFLVFLHHINYFIILIIDIFKNKDKYPLAKRRDLIVSGLKESRVNIIITIILLLVFKNIILKIVYTDVDYGILEDLLSFIVF